MSIEEAIELVKSHYNEACSLEWVSKKVAWALYQTWKEADNRDTGEMSEAEQWRLMS